MNLKRLAKKRLCDRCQVPAKYGAVWDNVGKQKQTFVCMRCLNHLRKTYSDPDDRTGWIKKVEEEYGN